VTLETFVGRVSEGTFDMLSGLSPFEEKLLKQCLGDAVKRLFLFYYFIILLFYYFIFFYLIFLLSRVF
jgi:hypothetical protein